MDRLFDRFAGSFRFPSLRRMFDVEMPHYESSFSFSAPAVDVSEDDAAYKITAELPGLEEENIDIAISGDLLTLKGEKHSEREEKDKNHYLSERSYGSFQRSFVLPESVDRDKIAADLAKGVLTITLPKTPAAQKPSKKIQVKSAA
jgi:HSP20 family protein